MNSVSLCLCTEVILFAMLLVPDMREQQRTDSGEETIETLEEVFQMIQKETGEDDLEILVTRFIQG